MEHWFDRLTRRVADGPSRQAFLTGAAMAGAYAVARKPALAFDEVAVLARPIFELPSSTSLIRLDLGGKLVF
jgi:hypothetical protein